MGKTNAGTVVNRRVLVDSLAKGRSIAEASDLAGYAEPRSMRRAMKESRIARRMLPCGVVLIETRKG